MDFIFVCGFVTLVRCILGFCWGWMLEFSYRIYGIVGNGEVLGTMASSHSNLYNELISPVFRALRIIPCQGERNGVGGGRG